MPHLARNFASNMSDKLILRLYAERQPILATNPESPEANELHALITIFKASNTWASQKTI